MASVRDDTIHKVMRGLLPASATPYVDWSGNHACGCSRKIVDVRRDGEGQER